MDAINDQISSLAHKIDELESKRRRYEQSLETAISEGKPVDGLRSLFDGATAELTSLRLELMREKDRLSAIVTPGLF